MGIKVNVKGGSFDRTRLYLKRLSNNNAAIMSILTKYGEKGVRQLKEVTPKKTGTTAESWTYRIDKRSDGYDLQFINTNVNNGVNIAVILQYGHGTNYGGYVQGIDYINPVIEPIFKEIDEAIKQELRA
jgi:hypothetical protein